MDRVAVRTFFYRFMGRLGPLYVVPDILVTGKTQIRFGGLE